MTRYGQQQEGAARGYNARMTANFWLRPGSSHSDNNALAFLDDSLWAASG